MLDFENPDGVELYSGTAPMPTSAFLDARPTIFIAPSCTGAAFSSVRLLVEAGGDP
jgi:hypothetical protein